MSYDPATRYEELILFAFEAELDKGYHIDNCLSSLTFTVT